MPTQVRQAALMIALTALVATLLLAPLLPITTSADAQEAGVQVTQFPGATVELTRTDVTRTLTTSCPTGFYAMAGGWSTSGTAPFLVTASYPSQLPGLGEGRWTLAVRKLGPGVLTVTPYVSCLSGATQLPE